MRPMIVCKDYSVFNQVCYMYNMHPQEMHFVTRVEDLVGCDPMIPIFIYVDAGTTRTMRECIDFVSSRYMNVTWLKEKYSHGDVCQYVCPVCGQIIQTYPTSRGVVCAHPGTKFEGYSPIPISHPRGGYGMTTPNMYGRPMAVMPTMNERWDFDVETFNGMGSRYVEEGPCTKCSEGLLKMEHLKESKDNYCKCEEGKKLRKQQKVSIK